MPCRSFAEARDYIILGIIAKLMAGSSDFPSPEIILEMSAEQIAPFILRELQMTEESQINRHNYISGRTSPLYQSGIDRKLVDHYGKRLMEAWIWLEQAVFIAPRPDSGSDYWFYVTERGRKIISSQDFEAYLQAALF